MKYSLLFVSALLLVQGCAKKVDGTSHESTVQSVEEMSQGLSEEETAQLKRDVDSIVYAIPPGSGPEYFDGMTRDDIAQDAHMRRVKLGIESARAQIETSQDDVEKYAAEDAIQGDAAAELAKVSIAFQPVRNVEGALTGCTLLVRNGSRHSISHLIWQVPGYAEVRTIFDSSLNPGESRVASDCGNAAIGSMEDTTDSMIATSAQSGVHALWAELEGVGPELRPRDADFQRDNPEIELKKAQVRLVELEAELADLE